MDLAAGRLFSIVGGTNSNNCTELECGQLSSSSESDGGGSSDDTEALAIEEEQSLEDGEAENDVDDETMSGDNDVEYTVNQPSLLSDLDSLTEPESLSCLTTSGGRSTTQPSSLNPTQSSSSTTGGGSTSHLTSIEDEMLLLRLIDMQSGGGVEDVGAGGRVGESAITVPPRMGRRFVVELARFFFR